MNAYCDRQSVDFNSIAFLFDGRRLRAEQTPDEVCLDFLSSHFHVKAAHILITIYHIAVFFLMCKFNGVQLEMEDGDEIDAMLHQTGGYVA